MKTKKQNRWLALGLVLCLLLGLLPGTALAAENGSTGIDVSTQTSETTYTCGEGSKAEWRPTLDGEKHLTGGTLTLTGNGTITAATSTGILLPANSKLVVEGSWSVTGADADAKGRNGISADGVLEVEVKAGASLTAKGGECRGKFIGGHGIAASTGGLTVTIGSGGSLTATGGNSKGNNNGGRGLASEAGVTVTNGGKALFQGGKVNSAYEGDGISASLGSVSLSGSGVTRCLGSTGIQTKKVTIGDKVQGCAAGSIQGVSVSGGTMENNSPGFAVFTGKINTTPSSDLDLSSVDAATIYTDVGGGTALWEPSASNTTAASHRLTLIEAEITGALKLPAGSNEVALVGNNRSISVTTGGSLTFSGTGGVSLSNPKDFSMIGIAPPPAGYYAKAWVDDKAGTSFGIPGSVFLEGNGGVYYPQTSPAKFNLTYAPVSGLRDDHHLLTVEGGYGGGVYVSGSSAPLEFTEDGSDFYGWELFNPETRESQGTTGILAHQDKETKYTMPDHHAAIRAITEAPNPPSPPAPSLETGEHNKYLNGYPDGTIRPEGNLTRAEAAQLFYNLMDEQSRAQYETEDCPFSDVSEQSWAYQAICTLANAGILMGDPDGTVTRAEFSSITARFDPGAYEGEDLFPDISNHWARQNINYAASKGWVQGYKDGTFRPKEKITRAEAATLINNVLGRAPETIDDLLPGRKIFTDNTNEKAWYYLALEEAANSHDYQRKDYDGILESWTALTAA